MKRRGVSISDFGRTPEGVPVHRYLVANDHGMAVGILDYGGIVTSIVVPDRRGHCADVVLGFDTLDQYRTSSPYCGAIVGRHAGVIGNGRFSVDGVEYQVACNEGPHHLHGGVRGFDKVCWRGEPIETPRGAGVRLCYLSRDGEEGYPGNLDVTVCYLLTDTDELTIEYHAVTDKPTIVNLTHHSYFNLAGHDAGSICDHELMIDADAFTPIDATMLPIGTIVPVAGTPFDFRTPAIIGARIDLPDPQLRNGLGYDHTWVLNRWDGRLRTVARVLELRTARVMEVATTEPGLQFYTGNLMAPGMVGKDGHAYCRRGGLCLEAQHYNDAPNAPAFPSPVLRPGQEYQQTTVYRFNVAG